MGLRDLNQAPDGDIAIAHGKKNGTTTQSSQNIQNVTLFLIR
jgi:hypothetical protein